MKSKYVKLYQNKNPIHDIDNQKYSSVMANLTMTESILNNSPFFNRTPLKTNNEDLLDPQTLYKLGQLDFDSLKTSMKKQGIRISKELNELRFKQIKRRDGVSQRDQKSVTLHTTEKVQELMEEIKKKDPRTYFYHKLIPVNDYRKKRLKQLTKEERKEQAYQEERKKQLSDLVKKIKQKRDKEAKYSRDVSDEEEHKQLSDFMSQERVNKFYQKLLKYRVHKDISFLNNPVDRCMIKCLFQDNDQLMEFYEKKYHFAKKDLRPFAQYTLLKEENPLFNDDVFNLEVKKVKDAEERRQSISKRKYLKMRRNWEKQSFIQPLQKSCIAYLETDLNQPSQALKPLVNDLFQKRNNSTAQSIHPSKRNQDIRMLEFDLEKRSKLSVQGDLSKTSRFNHFRIPKEEMSKFLSNREEIDCGSVDISQKHSDIQQEFKEFDSIRKKSVSIYKKMKKELQPKVFHQNIDQNNQDCQNNPGLQAKTFEINKLDQRLISRLNKQIEKNSVKWHTNELKTIDTEHQLKEFRANRASRI